jgi:hypothetical protein
LFWFCFGSEWSWGTAEVKVCPETCETYPT